MLRNVITTGKKQHMVSMNDSVNKLLEDGLIDEDTAKSILVNYQI